MFETNLVFVGKSKLDPSLAVEKNTRILSKGVKSFPSSWPRITGRRIASGPLDVNDNSRERDIKIDFKNALDKKTRIVNLTGE